MSQPVTTRSRVRTALVGILFSVALGAIGFRAATVHVVDGEQLRNKAERQYQRSVEIAGRRGSIYDRNKQVLAKTTETVSVAAYPAQMADPRSAARPLAKALGLPPRTVSRRLTRTDTSFVWLKRQVTPKEADTVKQLELKGIDFIVEHRRFYPHRSLAAPVLGFTGIDSQGLEGLEYRFNSRLAGEATRKAIRRDARGKQFGTGRIDTAARPGHNLVLTIDNRIQWAAEKAVTEAIKDHGALKGMAVVMDPWTGGVLAMVNVPAFNPNVFEAFDRSRWRNRAVADRFEPGSTMKIFSVAAGLEAGGLTPNSPVYCENGTYRIGNHTINDVKAYRWLTISDIVKYSSNIGAVKIGEQIGARHLHDILRRFGFGTKTQIDCPGETTGNLTVYKSWSPVDTGAICFGQGISVSAIQLTTAVAAIANGGNLMQPYIVAAIETDSGRVIESTTPQTVRRSVSERTAREVRGMMHRVISGGTGAQARLDGWTAAGKTGTAQKIDPNGGYAEDRYVSSFVGFAPVERPAVAILVVIDEPSDAHYGGTVAAPAFRQIAQQALQYLNIPPSSDTDRLMVAADREGNG